MSGSPRHASIATAILLGIALAVGAAGCSGSTDETVTSTTVGAPTTSVVAVSTTTTSAAIPGTTTTTGLVVSTTGPGEPTTGTTEAVPSDWQKASTGLVDLAAAIAQRLPEGQSVDLPDHLPAGWALAQPGQPFGDTAAGYFADQTENPAVTIMDGPDGPFGEYRVVFTDGIEIAGILVVIGDWGETDFKEMTVNGKTLYVLKTRASSWPSCPGGISGRWSARRAPARPCWRWPPP